MKPCCKDSLPNNSSPNQSNWLNYLVLAILIFLLIAILINLFIFK